MDHALFVETYASNGFSLIPLQPHDKRPAIPWKPYQDRHPTTEEVTAWFADESANIGIVTGRISDLTVLDCDSVAARKLAESYGLPTTWTVKTAHGWHFYFTYKEGSRNFQKRDDLPGIDLRSDGGYVVAPPSIHPDGTVYNWEVNHGPLAELPAWVLGPSNGKHKKPVSLLYQPCAPGERNDTLARLAGFWVSLGLDQALYIAHLWNIQNQPPLPWAEVVSTLNSIWQAEQRAQRSQFGGIDQ